MKILQLHVDFVEYEPIQKEMSAAEEVEKRRIRIDECLLLLITIEEDDDKSFANMAIEEIEKSLKVLKVNKILIYPYAHLSNRLADPSTSLSILIEMERLAKEKGIEVYRAPFGWIKRLSFSVKGHPLAEQLKDIIKGKPLERKIEKKYFVLTKDGSLIEVDRYKFKEGEEDFKILVEQEAFGAKGRENPEPSYIKFMKKFGIEWEEMSDLGHMRYGPLGAFILDMLGEYVSSVVSKLPFPVYFVRGTNMFNLKEKAIAEHASLFGQRMYVSKSEDRHLVLRYAACFQQFAMIKHWQLSYSSLPFGAFEIADSYRFEQSGELLLGFRVRRLMMPDLHVFCKDLEEAKEQFLILHKTIHSEMEKLGRKYVSLYNLTSLEFLEKNREFFMKLLEREHYPVLICVYPPGINYYWVLNIEYHIIDELGRAREIGTVQIDLGNAERFGITYVDNNGKKRHPIILHTAILGSLERFMYTIFDNLVKEENPTLPLWLSPIQVRIIPVSSKYIEEAKKLVVRLRERMIRADLDDREETVEKKVRDAETSWINYIIVFGEKEIASKKLMVRDRKRGQIREMIEEDLIKEIEEETKEFPKKMINLPIEVSKRPGF
ncbi:MAG: threonine--tRNA ligase [Candidatus Aenigmarchaeota archaeon]|nr:threonine--tRNA ligase [Candidatus Aenigmarchaeota archaeon]